MQFSAKMVEPGGVGWDKLKNAVMEMREVFLLFDRRPHFTHEVLRFLCSADDVGRRCLVLDPQQQKDL